MGPTRHRRNAREKDENAIKHQGYRQEGFFHIKSPTIIVKKYQPSPIHDPYTGHNELDVLIDTFIREQRMFVFDYDQAYYLALGLRETEEIKWYRPKAC